MGIWYLISQIDDMDILGARLLHGQQPGKQQNKHMEIALIIWFAGEGIHYDLCTYCGCLQCLLAKQRGLIRQM